MDMDINSGHSAQNIGVRQINIEVLRVVAMFLIVMGHYLYHLKKSQSFSPTSELFSYVFLQVVYVFTSIGVNLFVLITGYFLINRLEFRLRGMIRVSLTTIFYSLAIYILFCLFGSQCYSSTLLLHCFEPIPIHQYWFVAKYLGLILVAPFLSMMASCLERKEYLRMLAILFVLFFEWPYGEIFGNGMSLCWFCFLYLVGGYIRRYGLGRWVESHLVTIILIVAVGIFSLHVGSNIVGYIKTGTPFLLKYDANNSFTFFLALPVFAWFARRPMNGQLPTRISRIAPYTFGVYLLHEHSLMRGLLWDNIAPQVFPALPLFLHVLVLSIIVFMSAVIVDWILKAIIRI